MKFLGWVLLAWIAYSFGYAAGAERARPAPPTSQLSLPEWWKSRAVHPTGVYSNRN